MNSQVESVLRSCGGLSWLSGRASRPFFRMCSAGVEASIKVVAGAISELAKRHDTRPAAKTDRPAAQPQRHGRKLGGAVIFLAPRNPIEDVLGESHRESGVGFWVSGFGCEELHILLTRNPIPDPETRAQNS